MRQMCPFQTRSFLAGILGVAGGAANKSFVRKYTKIHETRSIFLERCSSTSEFERQSKLFSNCFPHGNFQREQQRLIQDIWENYFASNSPSLDISEEVLGMLTETYKQGPPFPETMYDTAAKEVFQKMLAEDPSDFVKNCVNAAIYRYVPVKKFLKIFQSKRFGFAGSLTIEPFLELVKQVDKDLGWELLKKKKNVCVYKYLNSRYF